MSVNSAEREQLPLGWEVAVRLICQSEHVAPVRSGNAEAAELLIERGADVNREAKLGLPLTVAVLKNAADHQGLGR